MTSMEGVRDSGMWEFDRNVGVTTSDILIQSRIYLGWIKGPAVDQWWYGLCTTTVYNKSTGIRVMVGSTRRMFSRARNKKRTKDQLLHYIWENYKGLYETLVSETDYAFKPEGLVGVKILQESGFTMTGGYPNEEVLPECLELMVAPVKYKPIIAESSLPSELSIDTTRRDSDVINTIPYYNEYYSFGGKGVKPIQLKKNHRVSGGKDGPSRFEVKKTEKIVSPANERVRSIGSTSSNGSAPSIRSIAKVSSPKGIINERVSDVELSDVELSYSEGAKPIDVEQERSGGAPTEWLPKE